MYDTSFLISILHWLLYRFNLLFRSRYNLYL